MEAKKRVVWTGGDPQAGNGQGQGGFLLPHVPLMPCTRYAANSPSCPQHSLNDLDAGKDTLLLNHGKGLEKYLGLPVPIRAPLPKSHRGWVGGRDTRGRASPGEAALRVQPGLAT